MIRWIHLSDFHIGKNNYESNKLLKQILSHLDKQKKKSIVPDFIFITGDIANKALEIEYETFYTEFIEPLAELYKLDKYSINDKIFIVPGNHDLERRYIEYADRDKKLLSTSVFFDVSKNGKDTREINEVRGFSNYLDFINLVFDNPKNWLDSNEAYFHKIIKKDEINVGIVGVNTAWLSRDNNDEKKLSPGIDIVEDSIKKIEKCDIKIILGHHPLTWFDEEHAETIKSIFADNGIIYIHGHLHKNRINPLLCGNGSFLEIQTGAGYQIEEHELSLRKNGFMWGEVLFHKGELLLQPRYWKHKERKWGISDDLHEDSKFMYSGQKDNWWKYKLPCPGEEAIRAYSHNEELTVEEFVGYEGWVLVNDTFFKSREHLDENELLLSFFDGAIPIFHRGFLEKLPLRNGTKTIIDFIKNFQNIGQSSLTLINGAGGEGKTTSLYQIILTFYKLDNCYILWHNNTENFTHEMFENLPTDKPILLISDDADKIVNNIFGIVKLLKTTSRNIHIVLGARQGDWFEEKGHELEWQKYINFKNLILSKLDLNESKEIVKLWSEFGVEGLKKLNGLSLEDGALKLMKATEDESSKSEGAFLGGMLKVRLADGLKDHMRLVLLRLNNRNIDKSEYSLLDAYAAISFMHIKGLEFLSFPVLSQYIFNEPGINLRSKIITPLGREAAATPSGDYIFTRHSTIASVTRELLSQEFNIEPLEVYKKLGLAAQSARNKVKIPKYGFWNYQYPEYFLSQNETFIAVGIAQSQFEQATNDIHLLSNLAKIYRKTKDDDLASELFHSIESKELLDRVLYAEWSLSEFSLNNLCFATWLAATSLSDFLETHVVKINVVISLKQLYFCFQKLYENYLNKFFLIIQKSLLSILKMFEEHFTDSIIDELKEASPVLNESEIFNFIRILGDSTNEVWEYLDISSSLYHLIPLKNDMSFERLKILLQNKQVALQI